MASLSVKDRAKMFGNLASPDNAEKEKSYRRIGNRVTKSPFLSPPSPSPAPSNVNFHPSPFSASSPSAKFPSSPFSSNSPKTKIPLQVASSTNVPISFPTKKDNNIGTAHTKTNSSGAKINMDWPDEDGIPAPGSGKKKSSTSVENMKPVILPLSSKSQKSSTPFKILNHKDRQGRYQEFESNTSKSEIGDSSLQTPHIMEQQLKPKKNPANSAKSPNPSRLFGAKTEKRKSVDKTVFSESNEQSSDRLLNSHNDSKFLNSANKMESLVPSKLSEKKVEKSQLTLNNTWSESSVRSQDRSTSNHNENKLPTHGNMRNKSTRAIRLMKARRAASPSPNVQTSLKQSLQAAKVVMEEEKSDSGSSDASSRSSLSNKELSDIARRALARSKNKMQNDFNDIINKSEHSSRGARILTKNSDLEARRALLAVTANKKKNTIERRKSVGKSTGKPVVKSVGKSVAKPARNTDVEITTSELLGIKANRVVAMKNSAKKKGADSDNIPKGMDIVKTLSTHSNDSSRSRRMDHPAFATRPAKQNISSAHILASFRQFNATRHNLPKKQKQVDLNAETGPTNENQNKGLGGYLVENPSDDNSLSSDASSMASLEQEETMHSVMPGELLNSRSDIPEESMRSMSERPGESMHSMSGRQGRSMHSSSGRKEYFYRMARIQITSKNNCNDTVMSSLSGNTQSLQSVTSQSVASKMMSPTNKISQKTTPLLEPTPEHSSQPIKPQILSPGPSNRSGHSFANSIISASPKTEHKSPSLRDFVNTSFMDTLQEKYSSSQESAGNSTTGNSAELLDAALAAAVEDMDIIDSPRKNPIAGFNGSKDIDENMIANKSDYVSKVISILPSSSGRSHSPPGFVFKDTEESDGIIGPPDPVGEQCFSLVDTMFGEDDSNSGFSNGQSEITNGYMNAEVKKGASKANPSVQLDSANEIKDPIYQKQGSTSTKQTVSTSIRSGMSSIQNGPVVLLANSDSPFEGLDRETNEGSTSIRTGLSGLQSQKDSYDMENSISIHTKRNTSSNKTPSLNEETDMVNKEESDARVNPLQKPNSIIVPKYPDTIHEENETKSTQKSSVLSLKDDSALFGDLKDKSTATTDGSSGAGTRNSSSGPTSSDLLGNDYGANAGCDALDVTRNVLPTIQTADNEGEDASNNGLSLLSPGSRSSRQWKGSIIGKNIGNAIKTVLAKASPRGSGQRSTPSGKNKGHENEESQSLFSLDDDDDDIFGGLEVEQNDKFNTSTTPRKQKIEEKTQKQKNFKSSGYNENSLSRRTNGSISRGANESPSQRTNESPLRRTNDLSRRTNESFSRRANESLSRRTNETGNKRKTPRNSTPRSSAFKVTPNTPSQRSKRFVSSPSPVATGKEPPLHSNDRSGTIVDESEVVHNVNSDITSSLIGGPISGPSPFQKAMKEASKLIEFREEMNNENEISGQPKFLKEEHGDTFTLLMETDVSSVEQNSFKSTMNNAKFESRQERVQEEDDDEEEEEPEKRLGSMLLNFGCGLVDPCSGFASLCTQNEVDDNAGEETIMGDGNGDKDSASVSSRSQLTSLEKKVWNEWDRLNESVNTPKNKTMAKNNKENSHGKKREVARDKLLDIANTAMSSQVSLKSEDDDDITKTTVSEGHSVAASVSSESAFTKDSESRISGNYSANSSATESGDSLGSSSNDDSTNAYSTSCSSADESDVISQYPARSKQAKKVSPKMSTPTAGPILLSFSQRSLMEKFSKQLTSVGVQVLKLNTRKQWQTRYFTVSTEQIALSAHEAISKSGEIAQCPKALLWLKKFNPKTGGYGIINIDKNGHGGMLLVDLVDIQVSDRKDDMLGNPIPKKLIDKFEKSVLVTLKYKMKGILRSIEFRCRDNDEAQFLCTCMRVIRDLLRRERSLRQKLSKQVSNKRNAYSSSTRRHI